VSQAGGRSISTTRPLAADRGRVAMAAAPTCTGVSQRRETYDE